MWLVFLTKDLRVLQKPELSCQNSRGLSDKSDTIHTNIQVNGPTGGNVGICLDNNQSTL